MGVPGWLLNVVADFLTERELILTYRGAQSGRKEMPGGGPQGTVLGMFLFIILINSVGFTQENRDIGERITKAHNAHKIIKSMHAKYIDDLTVAEALKLKNVLTEVAEESLERPLNYHQRTEHKMKENSSLVAVKINEIEAHARTNEMMLNKKKTKVMLFNTSTKYDFQPEVKVDSEMLEVVNKIKLLGVIVTDDLRWHENTSYITKKGYSRIWILRRLKSMGASKNMLLDTYYKQIRSVLEFASVVWNGGLTKENITDLERVQKSALGIILGSEYRSYEEACQTLKLKTLSDRREELSLKFAKKASEHPVHKSWFIKNPTENMTRTEKPVYKPVCTRTERFQRSAIPYLTSLLNKGK